MLYVRYQDYAAEIGMKDQLISENLRSLQEINKDYKMKHESLARLQRELQSETAKFT